jgi:hypothetical protein
MEPTPKTIKIQSNRISAATLRDKEGKNHEQLVILTSSSARHGWKKVNVEVSKVIGITCRFSITDKGFAVPFFMSLFSGHRQAPEKRIN